MHTMSAITLESPVGLLQILSDGSAVTTLAWSRFVPDDPDPLAREAKSQLLAYFAGTLTRFDLPLAPSGTVFRQKIWAALTTIAYAQTVSYADIARSAATAPRAVGGACGANPIPIIIPCHRVLATGRSLGGYSGFGGLATKSFLLDLERRHHPS